MTHKSFSNLLLSVLLITSLYTQAATKKYNAFKVTVTGKGQPMLFIPGATCSGDEWKETVARYAPYHECHVFTLAGYAGVPPLNNAPYLQTIKNAIEQYITDNKLNNVVLVGHSIGGVLAMWIASDMKEHLQKVVIVDAMPFFAAARNPKATAGFDEAQAKKMDSAYEKMDNSQLMQSQLMVARFMCIDSTKWNQIATWGVRSDKKTMAYTMTEMLGLDLRKTIADIQVPVLVLAAYAPSPQYPQFTRSYATAMYDNQYQQCKTCEVKVSATDSKHFIMYDAPQWYFTEIDSFLKS